METGPELTSLATAEGGAANGAAPWTGVTLTAASCFSLDISSMLTGTTGSNK